MNNLKHDYVRIITDLHEIVQKLFGCFLIFQFFDCGAVWLLISLSRYELLSGAAVVFRVSLSDEEKRRTTNNNTAILQCLKPFFFFNLFYFYINLKIEFLFPGCEL